MDQDGSSLASVVVAWLAAMRRRGLARGTIDHRRHELGRLGRWLGAADGLAWQGIDRHDLAEYLDERPLAPASRAVAISHIAAFYRWAVAEDLATVDPTVGLERPKLPRRLPRPASDRDLVLAFIVATGRTRIMLALAALAGLRCMEIAGLRWVDVDLAAHRLRVTGKGGRDRDVPIHPDLAVVLADAPRGTAWVLGRHIGAGYVSELGAQALRAAGLDVTMHQLRHRFGTVAYRTEPDLLAVADLLGHASITTTAVYAKLGDQRTSRIVAAMPGLDGQVPGQRQFT